MPEFNNSKMRRSNVGHTKTNNYDDGTHIKKKSHSVKGEIYEKQVVIQNTEVEKSSQIDVNGNLRSPVFQGNCRKTREAAKEREVRHGKKPDNSFVKSESVCSSIPVQLAQVKECLEIQTGVNRRRRKNKKTETSKVCSSDRCISECKLSRSQNVNVTTSSNDQSTFHTSTASDIRKTKKIARDANEVNTTVREANYASKTSGDASKTSGDASKTSGDASKTSGDASKTSGDASKTSGDASKTSGDASKTADDASKTADDASKTADDASKTADDASKTADDASKTADDASKTADDASKTADDASKTADDASKTADDASKTADDASKTADDASKTADDASKTADDASKTADDASKTADDASKTADDASKTADDASKTADDASKTADDASKTAADASKITVNANEVNLVNKTANGASEINKTVSEATKTNNEANAINVHISNKRKEFRSIRWNKARNEKSKSRHSDILYNSFSGSKHNSRSCKRNEKSRHSNTSNLLAVDLKPRHSQHSSLFPVHNLFHQSITYNNNLQMPQWNWIQHQKPPISSKDIANSAQRRLFLESMNACKAHQKKNAQWQENKHRGVDDQAPNSWNYKTTWTGSNDRKQDNCSLAQQGLELNSLIKTCTVDDKFNPHKDEMRTYITNHSSDVVIGVSKHSHTTQSQTKPQNCDDISQCSSVDICEMIDKECEQKQSSLDQNDESAASLLCSQFEKQEVGLDCQPDVGQTSNHLPVWTTTQNKPLHSPTNSSRLAKEPHLETDKYQSDIILNNTTTDTVSQIEHLITVGSDVNKKPGVEHASSNSVSYNIVPNEYKSSTELDADSKYKNPNSSHPQFEYSKEDTLKDLKQKTAETTHQNEYKLFPERQEESDSRSNLHSVLSVMSHLHKPSVHSSQVGKGQELNIHQSSRTDEENPCPDRTIERLPSENKNLSFSNNSNESEKKTNNIIRKITETQYELRLRGLSLTSIGQISEFRIRGIGDIELIGSEKLDQADSSKSFAEHDTAASPKQNQEFASFSDKIEEMVRSQNMLIPMNADSNKRLSLDTSNLNPNANEFSPKLRDCYGNSFVMSKQKGVSYFLPQIERASVNTADLGISSHTNSGMNRTVTSVYESYGQENTPKMLGSVFKNNWEHIPPPSYARFEQPSYNVVNTVQEDLNSNENHQPFYSSNSDLSSPFTNAISQSQSNESSLHTGAAYSLLPSSYYTGSPIFIHHPGPMQSGYSSYTSPVIPNNQNTQTQYMSPSYPQNPTMPMYIKQSHVATTNLPLAGTEHYSFLTPNPAVTGQYTTSVSANSVTSLKQAPFYSTPQPTSQSSTDQSSWSHAPEFNLSSYYQTAESNSSTGTVSNNSEIHHGQYLSYTTEHSNMPHNFNSDIGRVSSNETLQSMNNSNCSQSQAILSNQLNVRNLVKPPVFFPITEVDTGSPPGQKLTSDNIVSNTGYIADSKVQLEVGKDINKNEFEECRQFINRLRSRNVNLQQLRNNMSSEPEFKRYVMDRWLQLALRVIEVAGSTVTADEITTLLLSLQNNLAFKQTMQDVD